LKNKLPPIHANSIQMTTDQGKENVMEITSGKKNESKDFWKYVHWRKETK